MRLFTPSGHRISCGVNTQSRLIVWIVAQCHCRPRYCFVVAAQEEMCVCRATSIAVHPWVKWAQAHGTRETLDRPFGLAEPVLHPAAILPRHGQIGIEHKREI